MCGVLTDGRRDEVTRLGAASDGDVMVWATRQRELLITGVSGFADLLAQHTRS